MKRVIGKILLTIFVGVSVLCGVIGVQVPKMLQSTTDIVIDGDLDPEEIFLL